MSTISSWKNPVSGNYATASNWTNGVPNSTTIEAYLGTLSNAYTVTSGANETVAFLDVESGATLDLTGGVFTVFSSTVSYSNSYVLGAINISAGATMVFGKAGSPNGDSAEFNGGGTVNIKSSTTAKATLEDAAPWMGVYGTTVALSGNARIIGATTGGGNTFQNQTGLIKGYGTIGNGSAATSGNGLWLKNQHGGTIDATGAAGQTLTINTGTNSIYNAGLIETTGAGGLTIASSMQQDGQLKALGTGALTLKGEDSGIGSASIAAGASLVLNNGGLALAGPISVNAKSSTAPAASITTTSGNTTAVDTSDNYAGDVLAGDVYNAGKITVANDSTLNMNATLLNTSAGILSLAGSSGPTTLEIFKSGASIDHGKLLLSNSAENLIDSNGAGTQLSDYGSISGAGTIGDGWLRLYVAPGGIVNANGTVRMTIVGDGSAVTAGSELADFSAGVVETTSSGGLTIDGVFGNAGLLKAAGSGALTLNGAQINTGGGVVETVGKGSIVLEHNAQISAQGEVSISSGGTLKTTAGDTNDAIESTVVNGGKINIVNNSTVVVDKNWLNSGVVNLNGGSTNATVVDIAAGQSWKLLDAGALDLIGGHDSIRSGPGASLTNTTEFENRGNKITGAGVIGDVFMGIVNSVGSTIDATGALTLDAIAAGTNINNGGVIETTGAGSVTVESAMYNSGSLVANKGDQIDAKAAVFGGGVAQINSTGSIEFAGEDDNDVHFGGGGGGTLILDNYGDPSSTVHFYGNIYGLVAGDTIDLRDFAFSSGHMALGANSGFGTLDGTLTVSNGTLTSSALYVEGNYTSAFLSANHLAWSFAGDGHGGTDIKLVSTV